MKRREAFNSLLCGVPTSQGFGDIVCLLAAVSIGTFPPQVSTKPGNIDMKHYIFLPKSLKTVARAAGICVCIIFGWISVSHLAINSKEVLVVGSPTLIESRTSTMRWVSPLAASKNPVYGWTVMRIFATLLATLSLQLLLLVSWLILMDGVLSDASFSVVGWNPPIHQTSIVSITVPSIETQRAVWKSNMCPWQVNAVRDSSTRQLKYSEHEEF